MTTKQGNWPLGVFSSPELAVGFADRACQHHEHHWQRSINTPLLTEPYCHHNFSVEPFDLDSGTYFGIDSPDGTHSWDGQKWVPLGR